MACIPFIWDSCVFSLSLSPFILLTFKCKNNKHLLSTCLIPVTLLCVSLYLFSKHSCNIYNMPETILNNFQILTQLNIQWKGESDESERRSVVSDSLQPHGLDSLWNSPGQKTGVGSLSLLQGIFPTQGSNPGLPHCRWILYQLSHQRSPRKLSRGYSA